MKATKKLILAAVSLVAASSLTVGSTFAWFSYKANVELESVEFSVDSGDENLQVAVVAHDDPDAEPSAFSYSLKVKDIKDRINRGVDIKYKPLTVVEDGDDNTVTATNTIDLVNEDDSDPVPDGSYAVFDLIFRYTPVKADEETTETYLILNNGSEITAGDISVTTSETTFAWDAFEATDYGVALDSGAPINARARDAARVAFLYDDNGTTKNKVWAPSETLGIGENLTNDRSRGFNLHNLASDYRIGSKASVTSGTSSAPTYQNRIYSCIADPSDFTHSKIAKFPNIAEGKTYSELRLTVKVWLEGKDGDCMESFIDDSFAFLLKFRTGTIESGS